jgi:hypothetical protein
VQEDSIHGRRDDELPAHDYAAARVREQGLNGRERQTSGTEARKATMPRQWLDSDAPIECMGPSAVRQTMPGD